jgi:hypothetical protein
LRKQPTKGRLEGRLPTKDEEEDLSPEMLEIRRLGFDPRKRHFDVDRIIEEASEQHLNRSIMFERLSEAFGTQDTDFVWGLTQQLMDAAASFHHGEAIGFLLSVIRDIKPRDHLEGMLAAQMASIHLAMMHFTDELAPGPNFPINIPKQDSAARALTSLARTFASQMGALKHYRSGGEQRVTVQHVSVNDGGRAIVGNVDHTSPVPENTPKAAPALTDARQPAMEPIRELKVARPRR